MRFIDLSLLMALLFIGQGAAAATPSAITLIGNDGCFETEDTHAQLTQIIIAHQQQQLASPSLTLATSRSTSSLQVSLRVTNYKGALLLTRSYNLRPQDCPDVPALVGLVLEEFLKTLPLEAWDQEPIHIGTESADNRFYAYLLAYSEADDLSASFAGGLNIPVWKLADEWDLQMIAGLQIGLGPHYKLDSGEARELSVLGSLGAQLQMEQLFFVAQLLAGTARYQGITTPNAAQTWLPYLETAFDLGVTIRQSRLAARVSTPLLRHTLNIEGSNESITLSPFRLGIQLSVPL